MNGFCEKKFRSMLISGTFTKQFCSLFGLKDMTALSSAIPALRIVSLGFVLSPLVSELFSYDLFPPEKEHTYQSDDKSDDRTSRADQGDGSAADI